MKGIKNKNSKDVDSQKSFFIENIARYCDKCGKAYNIDDVEILQSNDYSTIIHFSCKNCKARHLATFMRPLGVSSRMPVNTDLSIDEIGRFAGGNGVTSNDVLDVHSVLKNSSVTVGDILNSR